MKRVIKTIAAVMLPTWACIAYWNIEANPLAWSDNARAGFLATFVIIFIAATMAEAMDIEQK